jgi:hypothetical protein
VGPGGSTAFFGARGGVAFETRFNAGLGSADSLPGLDAWRAGCCRHQAPYAYRMGRLGGAALTLFSRCRVVFEPASLTVPILRIPLRDLRRKCTIRNPD